MRLLNVQNWRFEDFLDERRLPKYAILSHTWGDKEVQYHHMLDLDKYLENEALDFYKIRFLCKQAIRDGFKYAWIDTCCINKESSAELTEAINSMFRWYQKSAICYVYMSDITFPEDWESKRLLGGSTYYIDHTNKVITWRYPAVSPHDGAGCKNGASDGCRLPSSQEGLDGNMENHARSASPVDTVVPARSLGAAAPSKHFVESRWFTRGWTLQELIAPSLLRFYDANGYDLGSLYDVINFVEKATGILIGVLNKQRRVDRCSIAMRMSWASKRQTTRIEDEAYCLLGIFDVNMPLLYGEGAKAFTRLQEEIIQNSNDQSILIWNRGIAADDFLAPSVSRFELCGSIRSTGWRSDTGTCEMTKRGLRIRLRYCYIVEDQDRNNGSGMKNDWNRPLVLLLDCLDAMKPGNYVAIKVRGHRDWHKETTVYISPDRHTMLYIPYQQRAWQLRSGTRDHAVGNSRRQDFILLRPGEGSEIERRFQTSIIVDAASLCGVSRVEGYPNAAWDMTNREHGRYSVLGLKTGTDMAILSITDDRGNTLILAFSDRLIRLLWHATLCTEQDAPEKIANYLADKMKDRQRRSQGFYDRETENDSLRLSNTKKLYIQFDRMSDHTTESGMHVTLEVISETRWQVSERTMQNAKLIMNLLRRLMNWLRRRAGQLVLWVFVMPVIIVPWLIEWAIVSFTDCKSYPVQDMIINIYEWLVPEDF